MSGNRSASCCAHPEALVVVAAVPLCQVDASEDLLSKVATRIACSPSSDFSPHTASDAAFPEGLPLRCAAVMPCSDALALVEEVGHVSF